jgi:hypothetical protein
LTKVRFNNTRTFHSNWINIINTNSENERIEKEISITFTLNLKLKQ